MYSRCLLLSLPAAPLTFPPHNKRAPLNALYGVIVGVLESCHLICSEDFAIPQSHIRHFPAPGLWGMYKRSEPIRSLHSVQNHMANVYSSEVCLQTKNFPKISKFFFPKTLQNMINYQKLAIFL